MKIRWYLTSIIAVFGIAFGCNDHPAETDDLNCVDGERFEVQDERVFCAYRYPIVIETGFRCPLAKPEFFDFEPSFGACTDFGPLNNIEIEFVLDRFQIVDPVEEVDTGNRLDLLFVVDNSSGMCEEQASLAENLGDFVNALEGVDFQIGITTTQLQEHAPEPIATPGVLQAQVQPIPGENVACLLELDQQGEPIEDAYGPLRRYLEAVHDCMTEPDQRLLEYTNEELNCAAGFDPGPCEVAGLCGAGECTLESIMPNASALRALPRVIRSGDYSINGELDSAALAADLRCATLVGTRGSEFEQGLGAVVAATDPSRTGGTPEDPGAANYNTNAANHGFVRRNAKFGVMFVSDEDDCTGDVTEDSGCFDAACTFAEAEGRLTPVAQIRDQLIANLSTTKGWDVTTADIIVGGIHGGTIPFEGTTRDTCENLEEAFAEIEGACVTNDTVFSGGRYEAFAQLFENRMTEPEGAYLCESEFTFMGDLGQNAQAFAE